MLSNHKEDTKWPEMQKDDTHQTNKILQMNTNTHNNHNYKDTKRQTQQKRSSERHGNKEMDVICVSCMSEPRGPLVHNPSMYKMALKQTSSERKHEAQPQCSSREKSSRYNESNKTNNWEGYQSVRSPCAGRRDQRMTWWWTQRSHPSVLNPLQQTKQRPDSKVQYAYNSGGDALSYSQFPIDKSRHSHQPQPHSRLKNQALRSCVST